MILTCRITFWAMEIVPGEDDMEIDDIEIVSSTEIE